MLNDPPMKKKSFRIEYKVIFEVDAISDVIARRDAFDAVDNCLEETGAALSVISIEHVCTDELGDRIQLTAK